MENTQKNDPLYPMIIQEQWEMLERRAKERSRRLEDAVGMQLFNNGVRGVLEWAASTLANMEGHDPVRLELSIYLYNCLYIYLSIYLSIYLFIYLIELLCFRDVQTAEAALARHNEIGDEIRTRQDEFGQLINLGETMYARAPSQDIQVQIKIRF